MKFTEDWTKSIRLFVDVKDGEYVSLREPTTLLTYTPQISYMLRAWDENASEEIQVDTVETYVRCTSQDFWRRGYGIDYHLYIDEVFAGRFKTMCAENYEDTENCFAKSVVTGFTPITLPAKSRIEVVMNIGEFVCTHLNNKAFGHDNEVRTFAFDARLTLSGTKVS